MVEIAVEELQFDLDLINLLFAEPAMEDGYVGDTNGGSGGSSDSSKGDSKSASSDAKGGDDKKETPNSTANTSKSDNKKDDDEKDEKKKDGKPRFVIWTDSPRSEVIALVKKEIDKLNAKSDDDKTIYVTNDDIKISEEDPTVINVYAKDKENGKPYLAAQIKQKAKDGKLNAPDAKTTTTAVPRENSNFINLQEMDKDELKKKFGLNDNTTIYGFKENGTVMYAHDKKGDQWYKCTASINPAKNNKTPASPEEIKMYDVNKHRSPDSERGFGEKIESFFKMIWELIERAIAKIKEKLARCTSGQKTFAKEIEKIKKAKKKPNMDIKVKNYIYNDDIINKLNNSVNGLFEGVKKAILFVKENADRNFDPEDDSEKKLLGILEDNPFATMGAAMGINGTIGSAGDFFNAVRRMYRGSEDVVEFKLSSKPNELATAENFVKSYDIEFNKILDKIDKTKKEFEPFKRTMDRIKSANKNKDNFEGLSKLLNALGKQYTVVINCYSFMASLLQERVYNCRNLFRRAYGAI